MRSVWILVTTLFAFSATQSYADTGMGKLHCDKLNLNELSSKFMEYAKKYKIDPQETITHFIDDSKKNPISEEGCNALTSARDLIARIEGPRVIDPIKPDPKRYPERFAKCSETKAIRQKIDHWLKKSGRIMYPHARIQIRSILKEADKQAFQDSKKACEMYDEVRNYILDIWPHFLKQLK